MTISKDRNGDKEDITGLQKISRDETMNMAVVWNKLER
jgi:hypothetical protein